MKVQTSICRLRAKTRVTTGGFVVLEPGEEVLGFRTTGYETPIRRSWVIMPAKFPHVIQVFDHHVEALVAQHAPQQTVPEEFYQYLFPDHRGFITLPGYRAD